MARREILPAIRSYRGDLAASYSETKLAVPELACSSDVKLISKLGGYVDAIDEATEALAECVSDLSGDVTEQAFYIRDNVLEGMTALRKLCDEAEIVTAADYWPFPTYGDLLFGV